MNLGSEINNAEVESRNSVVRRRIIPVFTLLAFDNPSHPVSSEYDIQELGYHGRFAVARLQNIFVRGHDQTCFRLSLFREWHVYGHLVAVEVSVEGSTDQWMKLDGIALDKHWLEGLNTKTVESRSTG